MQRKRRVIDHHFVVSLPLSCLLQQGEVDLEDISIWTLMNAFNALLDGARN